MRKLSFLFICIMLGIGMMASSAGADILKQGLNGLWFENVELVFDAAGNEVVYVPGMENPPIVDEGYHFAGIMSVQNVRIGADANHWDQSTGADELSGIFAVRVEKIVTGNTWTDSEGNTRSGARFTFGAPTITTFTPTVGDTFSTGLIGNEMFALYHDEGATAYNFNGTIAEDVADATDGPLWATFGHGAGADGDWGTADDDGYAYSYTDQLGLPAENFGGEAWYAVNAIQNNTGWIFPGDLNDPDEGEMGGTNMSPYAIGIGGIIANLQNDMYMNSLFGTNDYWDGSSPWVFESQDPAYIGAVIPEPATMLLLGTGLVGLAGFARRKRSKKVS